MGRMTAVVLIISVLLIVSSLTVIINDLINN